MADKEAKSWGEHIDWRHHYVQSIQIEHNILGKTGILDFFMGAVRQFVILCKCQAQPDSIDEIQQAEWLTQMTQMWVVSQQPGEYNPMHIHTQCQISSVMYLKVPKMLPSIKEKGHGEETDGSILFTSNASRDTELSYPQISFPPQVGDFYIFGAQQQHAVYPFRCAEGQKDVERRSISFNAIFQSKTDYDNETKK